METATVVSFLLGIVPAGLALTVVLSCEWVGLGVSEADEQARTLCIFCLQRIFTSFLCTCSRLEESFEAVV